MADYEPLDLTRHVNGGLEALGDGVTADIGPRHFRGLPFAIEEDPSRCFVALGGDSGPVTVPVGNSVHRVIFAHRLVTSEIDDGGPVGAHVADYVFTFANGQEHVVPIRERFEISSVPMDSFRGASGCRFSLSRTASTSCSREMRGRGRSWDAGRLSISRRRPRATSCGAGPTRNRTCPWSLSRSFPRDRRS